MDRERNTRSLLLTCLNTLWEDSPYPIAYWRGDFWRWTTKAYTKLSENDFSSLLMSALVTRHAAIDPAQIKRLVEVGKAENSICIPDHENMPIMVDENNPDLYKAQPNYLAFSNLILDLDGWLAGHFRVFPHTPRWFSDQVVEYPFEQRAKCPRWEAILETCLDGDKERISLLQEWFGYCLVRETGEQKFMIFVGEGQNGKSVANTVLEQVVGFRNCSHVPLEMFGNNFQLHGTLGKLVNLCGDTSEIEKAAEGPLKQFVGGDTMRFEEKYKSPISVVPTARIVLLTNVLPRIVDKSQGVWRRMILMPWDVVIPEDDRDKRLTQPKLKDWPLRKELPGIFNWAIEGLRRLRDQGHFTDPKRCREALAEYKLECNPTRQFLTECCCEDSRTHCDVQELYKAYRGWCDSRGYSPVNDSNFGREIKRCFPKVIKRQIRMGKRRTAIYTGLRIGLDGADRCQVEEDSAEMKAAG